MERPQPEDEIHGAGNPGLLGDWLTQHQLAEQLSVSVDTLQRWHTQRIGPRRAKVGQRVLYYVDDVRKWMLDQRDTPRGRS